MAEDGVANDSNDRTDREHNVIWRDGELVPFAEATIHVLSHAANRGTEVFDVLRVVETGDGPTAVGLRNHVARFDQSMELMGMEHPFPIDALERAVAETVLANPGSATVKLVAAWTEIAAFAAPVALTPQVYVVALPAAPGVAVIEDPVTATTVAMPKIPASILPPSLKVAAGYTPGIRYQMQAAAGFDDVVFKTVDGGLAESITLSLLVVKAGKILAPPLDTVLDGITRRLLIDVAHHVGVPVEVRHVAWDEVTGADELILSSTNHFLRPIGRLDDRTLDAPGPVTRRIADDLGPVVGGHHPLSAEWLTPLKPLVT